jgi:N utilization substance protein B
MGLRRKSREIAFKVLFSLEYCETSEMLGNLQLLELYPQKMEEIMNHFDLQKDERLIEFADIIIKNTILNRTEIDELINSNSKNWSMDRLAVTDKTLLRMGIYEIIYTHTPAAIVMDEIIEIAKRYCSESSGKFINGVLNAVTESIADQKDNNK